MAELANSREWNAAEYHRLSAPQVPTEVLQEKFLRELVELCAVDNPPWTLGRLNLHARKPE